MEIKNRIELIKLSEHFGNTRPVIAELGCAEGNFSLDLLKAGAGHLFMVDNWAKIEGVTGDGNFDNEWHEENFYKAWNKIKSFSESFENVTILKGLTTNMANKVQDNSLDILYLDAGHFYDAVFADLKAWYPKVKTGGIIAGHDYLNKAYGVFNAVADFVKKEKEIYVIPENNTDDAGFWFQK